MSPPALKAVMAALALALPVPLTLAIAVQAPEQDAPGFTASFSRTPDYPLTQDKNDAFQLGDGQIASGTLWTSRASVGWMTNGRPIGITLDLHKQKHLGRACVHTASRPQAAGVRFPTRIDVFASTDGAKFAWMGITDVAPNAPDGGYLARDFCLTLPNVQARYLRFEVETDGPFFMTDEIRLTPGDDKARQFPMPSDIAAGDVGAFALRRQALQRDLAALPASLRGERNGAAALPALAALTSALRSPGTTSGEQALRDAEDRLRRIVATARGNFGSSLRLRASAPYAPVSRYDAAPLPAAPTLQLEQGRHAVLAVAVDAGATDAEFRVETDAPTGVTARAFVTEPVLVPSGRWIGDALRPVAGQTLRVPAGESRQLFLDLDAAAQAPVGNGKLSVRLVPKSGAPATLAFAVRTWPALRVADPDTVVWGYLDSLPIRAFPAEAAADMLAHGVTNAVIPVPRLGCDQPAGSPARFAAFDRAYATLRGHRRYLLFLALEAEHGFPIDGAAFASAGWQRGFAACVQDWASHLKAMGIGYDAFALYPVDEPTPESIGLLGQVSRLVRAVDPRIRLFATVHRPEVLDKAATAVDILQLSREAYTAQNVASLTRRGKMVWSYVSDEGKLADPIGYYRAQGWDAFLNGATGFGFWSYADAGSSGTAWSDLDGDRPDYAVVYDDPKGILPSKRWQAWRDGVQDFRLLQAASRTEAGKRQATALARTGGRRADEPGISEIRARLFALATAP